MAQFPANIVTTTNIPDTNPLTTLAANNHSTKHNDMRNEIIAIETYLGKTGSVVNGAVQYVLTDITGADQAVGKTATQSVTNKTLGAGTKVALGSDVTGDIYYNSGSTTLARRGIGSEGQVLTSVSGVPNWQSPSAGVINYTVDTGTANAYIITPAPVIASYVTGQEFSFRVTNSNTSTSTININGLGVKNIFRSGFALAAGEIIAGEIVNIKYDGTQFQLFSQQTTPTGSVTPYIGASAPGGWLLCDGSAVSRTTYASLFTLASTTYGAGDGSTTFNLPDLRSRLPLGTGTGTKITTFSSRASNVITVTGLTNTANNEFQTGQSVTYVTTGSVITGLTNSTVYYIIRISNTTFSLATSRTNAIDGTVIALSSDGTGIQTFTQTLTTRSRGDTGGEESHSLVTSEIASHAHVEQLFTTGASGGGIQSSSASATPSALGLNTANAGGNTAHSIMNPFVVLNYIIKT